VQDRHARAWSIGPCCAHHLGAWRPQTPAKPKRVVVRAVFYEPGCVPRIGGCGRLPMAGEASRVGRLGGRSPGLPLAAAVLLPPQEAQGNPCVAPARAGRTAPSPLHAMGPPLAMALLRRDWGRAGRRKQNQKLQRPAAYRPGERSARFSPPPLRRPWEAQPPLRVAVAHSPQKKPSGKVCLFLFLALRA
jgi:hypothetical protein